MNLHLVPCFQSRPMFVICASCSRPLQLGMTERNAADVVFADRDGEPYSAFHCERCAGVALETGVLPARAAARPESWS